MIELDQLSRLGLGTSRVASLGSRLSAAEFGRLLQVASQGGVNLVDTADFYGSGDAERLLRQALPAAGAPYFIVTKAGLPCVHWPGWLSPLNQLAKKVKQKAGAKKHYTATYLIESVQRSNKRLGVEAVDAFLLHEPVWEDLASADSWAGLEEIRQRGLARFTGVSTSDVRVVEEGIRSGQAQLVQTSVCWNRPESDTILQWCEANKIPVLANEILRPYSALRERFDQHASEVHRLDGLADITLAQLLISAVLAGKPIAVALIGTSDLAHLRQNLGALVFVEPVRRHLPVLKSLLV